mgnify:CR=1 FL=1|jgi:hypothetical protein
MAPRTPRKPAIPESSTPTPPIAPPTQNQDSWTMNAVVQLTAATGRLESAVNSLTERVGEVRDGQDALQARIEKVERKMLIAATFFSLIIAIGGIILGTAGFVANKAIDFGLEMAKSKMQEQTPPIPPPANTSK